MPTPWRLVRRAAITTVAAAAIAAVCVAVAIFASPAAAEFPRAAPARCAVTSGTHTISSGGEQRSFLLTQPPGGASTATPMVLSIHGATGSSAGQQAVSTFTDDPATVAAQASLQTIGAREGFIAVFPQARESMKRFWDAHPGSVDVGFVLELTEYLHRRGCSSPATTTVNGFSMGAMLTSRLVCARADLYAGAAMVAGVLPPTPGCLLPVTTPVLVVHGQADDVVPYDGTLPAVVAGLAGEPTDAGTDRVGLASRWARSKDCPSPGWSEQVAGNEVTDLSCPPSTTMAVAGVTMGHDWNGPGLATSELIWAVMAPEKPCVRVPAGPANPAMAAAISARMATDVAFRTAFTRALKRQAQCNPHIAEALRLGLQREVTAAPRGPVASQLRFALTELARRPPSTW